MIKSGKTSIDPAAWVGKTKEEFFEVVVGKIADDKDWIWKQVQLANGDHLKTDHAGPERSGKQSKKP